MPELQRFASPRTGPGGTRERYPKHPLNVWIHSNLGRPTAAFAAYVARPSARSRDAAMHHEEFSCRKSSLFPRPPTKHGSPFSKKASFAKFILNAKKNML